MTKYGSEQVLPYNNEEHKTTQVRRMFDSIAGTYDQLNHTLSLGIDKIWRRKGIAFLRPFSPASILDIATGTGDLAISMHRRLKADRIIGADISEGSRTAESRRSGIVGPHHVRVPGLHGIDLSGQLVRRCHRRIRSTEFREHRARDRRDVPGTETGRPSDDPGTILAGAFPDEATLQHLFESRDPYRRTPALKRAYSLQLPAGLHQSRSAREGNDRPAQPGRFQRSPFAHFHFRHLFAIHGQ